MSGPTWIASTDVVFVRAEGTRVAGCVRVSLPEVTLEREARCWFNLEPIEKPCAIYGVDNLQALLLALRSSVAEEESSIHPTRTGALVSRGSPR